MHLRLSETSKTILNGVYYSFHFQSKCFECRKKNTNKRNYHHHQDETTLYAIHKTYSMKCIAHIAGEANTSNLLVEFSILTWAQDFPTKWIFHDWSVYADAKRCPSEHCFGHSSSLLSCIHSIKTLSSLAPPVYRCKCCLLCTTHCSHLVWYYLCSLPTKERQHNCKLYRCISIFNLDSTLFLLLMQCKLSSEAVSERVSVLSRRFFCLYVFSRFFCARISFGALIFDCSDAFNVNNIYHFKYALHMYSCSVTDVTTAAVDCLCWNL